jgi:hypothetical protein
MSKKFPSVLTNMAIVISKRGQGLGVVHRKGTGVQDFGLNHMGLKEQLQSRVLEWVSVIYRCQQYTFESSE